MSRPVLRTLLALAVAVLVPAMAACSSDPGGSSGSKRTTTTAAPENSSTTLPPIDPATIKGGEQAYIDAFVASYSGSDGSGGIFDKAKAECLAPKWVDDIGLRKLARSGLSPEAIAKGQHGLEAVHIGEATARKMVADLRACDIDVRQAVLTSMVPADQLPSEVGTCVRDAITDDVADDIFLTRIMGATDPPASFAPAQKCLDDYQRQQQQQQQGAGN